MTAAGRRTSHHMGDDCPGGHYASEGPGGACCTAFYDSDGQDHAWNCQVRATAGQPGPGPDGAGA